MPPLPTDLRSKLERVVVEARDVAEAGARAALESLAVHHREPYSHMTPDLRALRNHLRARARQLGDQRLPKPDRNGHDHEIDHLATECAYEHWHRMLFARFLAENNLLIEPEMGVAISLAEAEELAKEDTASNGDVWDYAARCAQDMLPQIFRADDPLLEITFAPEHLLKLEQLLASLPSSVFTASDALGWVYQFWQSKKKDEVNKSEVKIGADEISAVTQLFTEPYMVEFLLHNTLGAWWAGKTLTTSDCEAAESEDELRQKVSLPGVTWDYLRFVRGDDGSGGPWRPAAGTFDGWPKAAAELKVLDPCCGSGHFLVAALHHLVPIRMAEEDLSVTDAIDAVLRDNIHGLEIDERCCQIAAFALAFAAWTFPPLPMGEGRGEGALLPSPLGRGAGGEGESLGYRTLPELNIACTGIGPQSSADEWIKLAEQSGLPMTALDREPIRRGLRHMHELFSQAPTLGSLINPKELPAVGFAADFETIQPYLTAIMSAEKADDEIRERAIAAAGMVKAADLLAAEYTLVITNVPYLGRTKQDDTLKDHLQTYYKDAKADLATAFALRCLSYCANEGTASIVMPQNWLTLVTYGKFRRRLLEDSHWLCAARLGPRAFEAIGGEVVSVVLIMLCQQPPTSSSHTAGIDVADCEMTVEKAAALCSKDVELLLQHVQRSSPGSRFIIDADFRCDTLLEHVSTVSEGLHTGDYSRFGRTFWEIAVGTTGWELHEGTAQTDAFCTGKEGTLYWEDGQGELIEFVRQRLGTNNTSSWIKGHSAWGNRGIAVSKMSGLRFTLYVGYLFTHGAFVIVPDDPADLAAIWCFAESGDLAKSARRLDPRLAIDRVGLAHIPVEIDRWRQIAKARFPHGLPEPESDDPTQWLFHGRPEESTSTLQVAVGRLLGYRWPAELDSEMRLSERARALIARCDELARFVDDDGIVCIPSVRGEEPLADRLLALLTACSIAPDQARELAGGTDLDTWLRTSFFEEHCKLFHLRPFVWHIWDGRTRDGFHALVNYHKLAESDGTGRKTLESLTYSYLGDWIGRMKDAVKQGEGGAEDRLAAALELQKRLVAILDGEPPYDIFVRWKPLAQQPIGWEPDINDGVRLNIRPFMVDDLPKAVCRDRRTGAGILRWKPNVKWKKDRGKEPKRSRDEYPWFWGFDPENPDHAMNFAGGKEFDGNRWNDLHYTNQTKQEAREGAG
ncbi:MAG: SAM-dependent DNA methyltransferase [Planctomycetes bacterium]|nr:SAM-dependent DNA methyltransferase [Planctomycetota bacterium]NOG54182.1 N-6 DNA methylase [Planctomycetota bacterium]